MSDTCDEDYTSTAWYGVCHETAMAHATQFPNDPPPNRLDWEAAMLIGMRIALSVPEEAEKLVEQAEGLGWGGSLNDCKIMADVLREEVDECDPPS